MIWYRTAAGRAGVSILYLPGRAGHLICVEERVRKLNDSPVRENASYVLYWCQANRRGESNQALDHAISLANHLKLPVLFLEQLTCDYPYANDRLHTFVLEGVPDTARVLRENGIGYVFHMRPGLREPDGVIHRLAADASAVVTDDFPTCIAARNNAAVPQNTLCAYFAVDASCIVPGSHFEKREYAAYTIRPKIRRLLPRYLAEQKPFRVVRPWKRPVPHWHTPVTAETVPGIVASCEIDHRVKPSLTYSGGRSKAVRTLERFLAERLRLYDRERNEPAAHATSELSPYLHFGNISALEIALAVKEHAEEHKLMADGFLEELIVRRELAFNFARNAPRVDTLDPLPEWVRETLRQHRDDARPHAYTTEQFEQAETHDPLWNAAQKELLLRGKIHGYYRMYWGKKIIQYSPTYEDALQTMIYLHDRYALDGRDPNTYTNILWCFGLHDRPWFDRPVLGTIRYMSLEGMRRKTNVDGYLREIEYLERTGSDPFRIE